MKKIILIALLLVTGMTLSGCQEESPDPITCDEGFELQGEECVQIDITPTCEADEELVDNECVALCAEGFDRVDGECVEIEIVCDDGYEVINGECEEIRCVPGYILIDNVCTQSDIEVCKGKDYYYDYDSLEYELVWADEFEGTELNLDNWRYEVNGNGGGNNEEQFYTSQNVVVEDGFLKIIAKNEDYNGFEYTSSRITTQYRQEFKYGIIEFRAKLPGGRGTWPALWMMPVNSVYGTWPNSGEIDVVELVGYDENKIHATIHTDRFNHKEFSQKGSAKNLPTATTDFHVYKVEWLPDRLNFYVDDEMYFTFIAANYHPCPDEEEWPFDKMFFLIMNVAIGGDWGGVQGIDDTIFPVAMEVDYVRVYQSEEITNLKQTYE